MVTPMDACSLLFKENTLLFSKMMHFRNGKGANVAVFFPHSASNVVHPCPSHNASFWDWDKNIHDLAS